jgi:predicted O-methyltransferase YrrM
MTFSIYSQLTIPDTERYISLTREDAEFIFSFLQNKKITSTLEIGLAYGCSASYILSATKSIHYVIDPFQKDFDHLGMKNIKKLGLDHLLQFENGCSHEVLPRLLKDGKNFDFVFIDGDHKYDSIFVDFYYADLLLNQNGYVLFHDIWMSSTQMICSWINTNKTNYAFIPTSPHNFAFYQKKGQDHRAWDHFNEFHVIENFSIANRLKSKIFRMFRINKGGNE